MSGTLTPYGRRQILASAFMPEDYVAPSGLWLVYTGDVPSSNADGTELDERPGLTRTSMGALSVDNWNLTDFAEIYNTNVVAPADATADAGLIFGWAVVDSATIGDGNVWMVGEQIEPFTIDSGDTPPAVDVAGLAVGIYD